MGNEEIEKVEVKEKEILEIDQTASFFTQAFDHYQQNARSQKLNYISIM